MRPSAPSLMPILRSAAQGRLLAILAASPQRLFGVRELAVLAQTSPMTAQREVERAERAGVVTSSYEGRNRRVRFNEDHPLVQPLRRILVATYGAPQVITEEFRSLRGAQKVLLFGSWAARYLGEEGPPPADIDVLVIGDHVDRDAVDAAADRAERRLHTPVQVTIRSHDQWEVNDDPFMATVRERELVTVLSDDEHYREEREE